MSESHHEHHEHLGESSQWSVYESNVQSYRNMALSSQSLYLAVGAILLANGPELTFPFYTVLVMALVTSWFIWFPVIFSRTAIVDFHKFDLSRQFDREGNPRSSSDASKLLDREYARTTNWKLRRKVYSEMKLANGERFRTIRVSRTKIDLLMPIMISVVWVIFGISEALGLISKS